MAAGGNNLLAPQDPVAACLVPEEPALDAAGVIRVQIRMQQERIVRRFLSADPALQLWAFVARKLGDGTTSADFDLIGPGSVPLPLTEGLLSGARSFADEKLAGSAVTVRMK